MEVLPNPTESQTNTVIGVIALCQFLVLTTTCLRLWTRKVILNQVGLDDWCALVTLLATLTCGTFILLEVPFGLGKHIQTVQPTDIPMYLQAQMFYFSILFYNVSMMFVKLTFLLQYYRVLATEDMRKWYIVVMVLVTGWTMSQVFVSVFNCWPIRGFWDMSVKAKCIPQRPLWYINAAGHIFTDLVILIMPIPAITRLKLPRRQRIILILIFGLGFFTVAISGIRTTHLSSSPDITWDNVTAALWSLAELTSALVCVCLATLRPLLTSYFPALATKYGRSSSFTGSRSWVGGENPRYIESQESGESDSQLHKRDGRVFEMEQPFVFPGYAKDTQQPEPYPGYYKDTAQQQPYTNYYKAAAELRQPYTGYGVGYAKDTSGQQPYTGRYTGDTAGQQSYGGYGVKDGAERQPELDFHKYTKNVYSNDASTE
ncbi:hypothetical protein ACJZ2D_000231 [Fusarium nematophilum]